MNLNICVIFLDSCEVVILSRRIFTLIYIKKKKKNLLNYLIVDIYRPNVKFEVITIGCIFRVN